jgi:oligopeptide/dipeptide ABC transporter ATP-binding protein
MRGVEHAAPSGGGSAAPARTLDTLLHVDGLRTVFATDAGAAPAVDGVEFRIARGETLGMVGESGCGKSVTALSIMRLVGPPGRIAGGSVVFEGRDLLAVSERELRRMRGNEIAMIFQEPMTSLNPVLTVGAQIAEAVRLHHRLGRLAAWQRAVEMLRLVEMPDAEERARSYPHQLSGGMRQRVMIAMAMSCAPRLLIADEPTTALDVTIQAQILELLASLRARTGMAMLLITHNLGIVAEQADHVAIMYAGRIVERAPVRELFERPLHPYTIGLLASVPGLGGRRRRLEAIPGIVPDPRRLPSGCRFRDRCSRAVAACAETDPALEEKRPGHMVACIQV